MPSLTRTVLLFGNQAAVGASAVDALLAKFNNPEGHVVVFRTGVSIPDYSVLMDQGDYIMYFPLGDVQVDTEAPEFGDFTLAELMGGAYHTDFTKNGSWSTFSSPGYGETYTRTAQSGAYCEYTTPDGVTEIGVWDLPGVEAGLALVEIDGDKTLANALPTVQDLINSSRLADTALIANGGTLNPTDRILDAASPTSIVTAGFLDRIARRVRIADNLTAGSHIVKITNSGYRPTGGASDNIRLYGLWFDDPTVTLADLPTAKPSAVTTSPISSSTSDNNFAFSYTPTGGSTAEWLGHSGTQFTTTAEVYVDDVLVSPFTESLLGSSVEFRVTAYCRHSESVDDVAEYTQRVIFNASEGVTIHHEFTWLVAGTVTGYIPQISVNDALSKGSLLEASQDYDLSAGDATYYGNIPASAAYLWTPGGNWATMACVKSYESAPVGIVRLEDRSGNASNKIYFQRYDASAVAANNAITLTAIYRFKYFDDADAELARA
jgi:hypothetical protein